MEKINKLHDLVTKYLLSYDEDLKKTESSEDFYLLVTALLTFKNLILAEVTKHIEVEGDDSAPDIIEIVEAQAKLLASELQLSLNKKRN